MFEKSKNSYFEVADIKHMVQAEVQSLEAMRQSLPTAQERKRSNVVHFIGVTSNDSGCDDVWQALFEQRLDEFKARYHRMRTAMHQVSK